ncbi:MAG TPA: AraC family transcriptional regulator [Gemmatimonadaceae bacterium]|nr:AraC family transcriptional regulator [Gemmatimonadaceae bacterium]
MTIALENGDFAGIVRHSRQVLGITLAETSYSRGLEVGMHAHTQPLCSLVLEGEFTERRSRGSTDCLCGNVLFHPREEAHGHRFREPSRLFNIQFSGAWLAWLDEHGVRLPRSPRVIRRGLAPAFLAHVRHEVRRNDSASALATEGAVLSLVAELARLPTTDERLAPRWLSHVTELLEASLSRAPGLAELAAVAGVHPAHLARTFQRFHGCSAGEYARRLQVERARRGLLANDRPLSQVALDAGFSDQPHFTRTFRAHLGVTPGEYRKAMGVVMRGPTPPT